MALIGLINLGGYVLDWFNAGNTSRELRELNQQASVTELPSEAPAAVAAADTAVPAAGEPTASMAADAAPASDPTIAQADTAADSAGAQPTAAVAESETQPAVGSAGTASSGQGTSVSGLFGTPYPDNPTLKVSDRFKALRKKSSYIMGWLKLDGVDEPVVQKDNSFFLTHDAMGRKNINGAIFLDQSISLLSRPNAIMLFGHNMKTGAMFGNLRKFEKSSYYFNHWIISFDSLYDEGGKYIVFGVCKPGVVRGAKHYADVYDLLSNDSDLRAQALDDLLESSMHAKVVNVTADDQLLLLITCTNDDTERLIIAARRLRAGETEDRLDLDF